MKITDDAVAPGPVPTEPVSPKRPQGFVAELFDAITVRTVLLVFGVLLIQLAFVLSYVGAFHHPTPHHVPVAVVAPSQISGRVVTCLLYTSTLSQLGGLVDRGGPGTLRTGIPGDSLGGVPKTEDVQDLTVHLSLIHI